MSKKYFELAASILKQMPKVQQKVTFNAFAELFIRSNPKFDKQRFRKACGLEEKPNV